MTLVFLGYQSERDVSASRRPRSPPIRPWRAWKRARRAAVPPRRSRLYALDLADADGALGGWQQELSDRLARRGAVRAREARRSGPT